jgi:hypothetical protein
MATTTNYGWTTPDDTALVKDGAAAIRTLGTSVDTTTKALNPSTTLGDIEYRSSTANTNTRLGIGSTGNVLTVAGGVPTWAAPAAGGAFTLLSTTSLSGATTTISSINQTYKSLYALIFGVSNATADGFFIVKPNGNTNFAGVGTDFSSTSIMYPQYGLKNAPLSGVNNATQKVQRTNTDNVFSFTIGNYTSTTNYKTYDMIYSHYDTDNYGAQIGGIARGAIADNSAITSLVFSNLGGNLSTGTVLLYGVN